jgi:hypothetical protein
MQNQDLWVLAISNNWLNLIAESQNRYDRITLLSVRLVKYPWEQIRYAGI